MINICCELPIVCFSSAVYISPKSDDYYLIRQAPWMIGREAHQLLSKILLMASDWLMMLMIFCSFLKIFYVTLLLKQIKMFPNISVI